MVKDWIKEDPTNRAKMLSYHIDSPSLDREFISPLTEYILSQFSDNDEVFNEFIRGRYPWVAYSPDEVKQNRDSLFKLLKPYKNSVIRRIREWAEYEINRIENIVKDCEIRKSETLRY